MNKKTLGIVVAIIAVGILWYLNDKGSLAFLKQEQTTKISFAKYDYECDEHVLFSITPSLDRTSIKIMPREGGVYPPESTLVKKEAIPGVEFDFSVYEGNGIMLMGKGSTIVLGEGDGAINCSPVEKPDETPFTFES